MADFPVSDGAVGVDASTNTSIPHIFVEEVDFEALDELAAKLQWDKVVAT